MIWGIAIVGIVVMSAVIATDMAATYRGVKKLEAAGCKSA